jgi:uncharacterized FAD-dependent dehydrogenase
MRKELVLTLSPQDAADSSRYAARVADTFGITPDRISALHVLKRSVDARRRHIVVNLTLLAVCDEPSPAFDVPAFTSDNVSAKDPVVIVGAGPAGLFAALRLIERGLRPIVLERGKDVSSRKRDIALIHRGQAINTESNYCFGEGGAGTFSDGKLYTRSKKRGNNRRALEILRFHGAQESILYEAHPHIGSDRLPTIIAALRKTILQAGGEVHFETCVSDLVVRNSTVKGVLTQRAELIEGKAVILATGHSARDIYELLNQSGILLEAKPFAMGVRIEHPQLLINDIQYHRDAQMAFLPPAAYALVHQAKGRGVYSFCMCPGGFIVPSATAPHEVVVNGMSPSLRNSPFANAGLVVEIRMEDLAAFAGHGPLAGLRFQQRLEQTAFLEAGEKGLTAPAQRATDFVAGKASADLPETSYLPGLVSSPLHTWLPASIGTRLREGLSAFDQKMRGYLTSEAVLVGVESRTSSPVRIPRDRETLQHVQLKGLYPCGEGAGYAGGILSSAIDGENCADAVAAALNASASHQEHTHETKQDSPR